jgi:phosphoribosylaminoimidazolecarboxamide formyltransferase/IMP cyclohydrolase
MRALLSVSDKTDIVPFGTTLWSLGWDLIATEGTAALLAAHDVPAQSISTWMNLPALLDGRVKTLHHKVFLALLCRGDRPGQLAEAATHGVRPIDLIAGSFYRFGERPTGEQAATPIELLESIDIGGPAMMRAAAKNHPWVIPLVDPADYERIGRLLGAANGAPSGVGPAERRALAAKAFRRLADLDTRIAVSLSEEPAADHRPPCSRPGGQEVGT